MYGETRTTTVDPETSLLEICPKCRAMPGTHCVSEQGNRVHIHQSRMALRKQRESLMYEPANYKKVLHKRKMHRIRREKQAALQAKHPERDYYIFGTGDNKKTTWTPRKKVLK